METLRTFIAVPLPPELREALARLSGYLQKRIPGVKWVKPDDIHLTLKFLGGIEAGTLPEVKELIGKVSRKYPPQTARVGGLGAFPCLSRPRVIWVGVEPSGDTLAAVVGDLEAGLEPLGIPREERPYHPHLTLGRVKSPVRLPGLEAIFRQCRADSLGALPIDMLLLIKSTLTPQGARYESLFSHRISEEF